MKTKVLFLLAITAIVTFSFTFSSVTKTNKKEEVAKKNSADEPAGGFVSEDKF